MYEFVLTNKKKIKIHKQSQWYTKIIAGYLEGKHINLLILLGFILKSDYFVKWLLIMIFAKRFKDYKQKKY